MSGKIVECPVGALISVKWVLDRPNDICSTGKYVSSVLKDVSLNKEDTAVLVFGPHQESYIKQLEDDGRFNILYKSVKSVNGAHWHGSDPRNTVVILEWK